MQRCVGIDDTDQSDVREIQTLGNHLGSQQYPNFTLSKTIQGFLMATMFLHRIAIHP